MRKKLIIATISTCILLLMFSFANGQNRYFLTNEGKIVDSNGYEKLKNSHIKKLKLLSSDKSVKIVIHDSLTLQRRSGDSLIYSYEWTSQVVDPNVEIRAFNHDRYLEKPFPLNSLKSIDKKAISLKDLKGKPTLINFWFTTCKPCIEEIPVLNAMRGRLKDSVNFVAISFESIDVVSKFLAGHVYDFVQIANAERFVESLGINSFPVNIFLDKDGVVRRIENGIPYTKNNQGEFVIGDGKKFEAFLRTMF